MGFIYSLQASFTFNQSLGEIFAFSWKSLVACIIAGDVIRKGMESANNDARKWPILPFDESRDFIISKEILA